MNFQTLLNDYNGSVLLEPGTSEWGYVEQQWYLMIPFDSKDIKTYKNDILVDPFTAYVSFPNFIACNFETLNHVNALGNPEKALFGAMLRAHCMKNGMFDMSLKARCVIDDEYQLYEPLDRKWESLKIPAVDRAKEIAAYVKKFGDTFVQMMVYVFCSRGHHWQDEFDGLYDKLFKACSIPKPATWSLPTNREIFRQILHCFGVKLPLDFTLWCKANNRMANPIRLRFTPHAPVAGAAQITTLAATLTEMQSEGWYQPFYEKFEKHISVIYSEINEIKKSPYQYHVASRVVTGLPKIDLSDDSIQAFKGLCQLALGYIDHLGKKHSLSGQKVITQKSGGVKPVSEAFSKACDRFGRPDANVADMVTFLSQF